jgi:hypothetical protein
LPGANKDHRYEIIQENITLANFQVDSNEKKNTNLLVNSDIYQRVRSIFDKNNLIDSEQMKKL